jgi:hypothetical protein
LTPLRGAYLEPGGLRFYSYFLNLVSGELLTQGFEACILQEDKMRYKKRCSLYKRIAKG